MEDGPDAGKQEMIALLRGAVERGITFFDTASIPGGRRRTPLCRLPDTSSKSAEPDDSSGAFTWTIDLWGAALYSGFSHDMSG